MKIAVPAEADKIETRVAATPETVKKFIGLGADGGGRRRAPAPVRASPTREYAAAGATHRATMRGDARRRRHRAQGAPAAGGRARRYKPGALVVGIMDPYGNETALKALADAGVAAFAMELMPRITRAQVMDVLSSQANLAGYQAVIDAAAPYGRALPMMMTAAGTVPAARVFVMGAGVAGLQAIATARRLGAVVSATDVRPAAKEQVESLGAKFIAVDRRRVQAGRDRRRLRQADVGGIPGEAGGARRRAHQEAGHRHHHGADPRPAGAAARLRRDGRLDAARVR